MTIRRLSLDAAEAADAFHARHVHLTVHPGEAISQARLRLVGRCKKAFGLVEMADEPVGPFAAALHIKAAAEGPAAFQYAEGLPVRRLLVREGVKAVEGQHDVKALVGAIILGE